MKKKYLILLLILLTFELWSQSPEQPSESGKCYSKALVISEPESDYEFLEFYSFKPNIDLDGLDFRTKKITLDPDMHIKAQRLHPEYIDSLIWEREIVDLEELTFKIAKKRKKIDESLFEKVEILILKWSKPELQWREVVCDADISKELIDSITQGLIKEGWLENPLKNESFDLEIREVSKILINYQEKYSLPKGNINYETLDHMGIVLNEKY